MKITRAKRLIIAGLTLLLLSVVGISVAIAATLLQTPNISTGEPAINRAVACSQTTVYCYAIGGGADSGTKSDVVHRYNRSTDAVDTVATLPVDAAFLAYASGGYSDVIVAHSSGSGVSTNDTYIYNETSNTWSSVSPGSSITSLSLTGGVAENYFYLFGIDGDQFNVWRLNLDSPSSYTLVGAATGWTGYILQQSKVVYDPDEKEFLIFLRDNGVLARFSIVSNTINFVSDTFPPCDSVASCVPSLAFYDNDLGILAGSQGTPSSTTIGLYQYSWVTNTFGASTVETLTDTDFNSQQFTTSGILQPDAGWATTLDGETETFFGSSRTFSASPGYNANEYWLRTGDPGGLNPSTNNIDSWLTNILTAMGMNSPVGKLLVGSSVIIAFFLVLSVKGVPWIMSLGVAGLAAAFLTAAELLDGSIILSLAAIVMLGAMGLIFSLFMGGDRNNG